MTKTALRKARTTGKVYGLKAVGDPAEGIFEAYVSIFGNVDYHGDRIRAGAFADSLSRWKTSGDPIPVIFSHQWDDLDAHIGEVLSAEEHLPGDARLPAEIMANGGLWTRFQVEMDEDFAARVAKKLTKRTLREFSFAYDVLEEERATDGVNELVELDVLEVGPTLKGANPATVLLAKALGDDLDALSEDDVLDRLAKALEARGAKGEKSSVPVTFEGSIEDELDAIYAAAYAWASGGNIGNGGFYALHQEATYLEEGRVVVLVEGWSDPWGEGIFYELNFSKNDDGDTIVEEPHELEVSVDVSRKSLAKRARWLGSALAKRLPGTVPDAPKTEGKTKDKAEDPERGKAEDPESRTGSEGDTDDEDAEDADLVASLDLAEVELATT